MRLHCLKFKSMPRTFFTLLELLVVIVIITILATLFFPAFMRAKAKAHEASCQNNLKNITLGVASYIGDNNEWMPTTSVNPSFPVRAHWQFCLWPDWVSDPHVYWCPSSGNTYIAPPIAKNTNYNCDYAPNSTSKWSADGGTSVHYYKYFEQKKSSLTIMIGDGPKIAGGVQSQNYNWWGDVTTALTRNRHRGSAMFCFWDFHVAKLKGLESVNRAYWENN